MRRSWTGERRRAQPDKREPGLAPGGAQKNERVPWRRPRTWAVVAGVAAMLASGLTAASLASGPAIAQPDFGAAQGKALLVGSWHGHKGQFQTIQDAVNAARPGDWVLVGPGDYRESSQSSTGVLVTTPGVHIRGMDRNQVIVDGTLPGATHPCDPAPSAQNFGLSGRNGITVFETSGDTVQNLTACNFLPNNGSGGGNEIWFNGGDGTGQTHLGSFFGSYLTATSTYTANDSSLAQYGIFVSNSHGPGDVSKSYASNMADASYYVGACPNCNVVLDHDVGEHSVLGYSGTNAGGNLIIQRSVFRDNSTGIVPNSLNNDDAPPPQNGACPNGQKGPYHTALCTVIRDNQVSANNNPNVPGGQPGGGSRAIGAGIVLAGGQNDLVIHNHVVGNGSWGILVTDYPDLETPPPLSHCQGGISLAPTICDFPALGNEVRANVLDDNGSFANPTNGDLGEDTLPHNPGNCWLKNREAEHGPQAVTSDPAGIQSTQSVCGAANAGDLNGPLGVEVACATQALGPCTAGGLGSLIAEITFLVEAVGAPVGGLANPALAQIPVNYPEQTQATAPFPAKQPTMPDPCQGVPDNPWCR